MKYQTISVIGLGYIGLPTAAIFASRKVKVIGVDVNQQAVDTINKGMIHIIEPELDIVVRATVNEGYLRATTQPEPADAFLIAVPTPFKTGPDNTHEPDLSYIKTATDALAPVLKKGDLVILESTSPVGTTEQIAEWLASARTDLSFPQNVGETADINIAHCPERVLPGHVMRELVENDRIIGGLSKTCSARAIELYQIFVRGDCITTSARTAEMAKLTENASRDVSIAFANELSVICDKQDINVWELIRLANRHPRVNILQPGPGVGGHCIAVDPWFIVSKAPEDAQLIKTARQVNDNKPQWVIDKVQLSVAAFLQANPDKTAADVTIACFGLAFKADIDDLRESPAMLVAGNLCERHPGKVLIIEPNIDSLPTSLSETSSLASLADGLSNADILVFLVDHKEFKNLARPNQPLIDTRGIFA